MDPTATLYDLIDAMSRDDREDVDQLLDALREWNRKGGFLPNTRAVCPTHGGRCGPHVPYKRTFLVQRDGLKPLEVM